MWKYNSVEGIFYIVLKGVKIRKKLYTTPEHWDGMINIISEVQVNLTILSCFDEFSSFFVSSLWTYWKPSMTSFSLFIDNINSRVILTTCKVYMSLLIFLTPRWWTHGLQLDTCFMILRKLIIFEWFFLQQLEIFNIILIFILQI